MMKSESMLMLGAVMLVTVCFSLAFLEGTRSANLSNPPQAVLAGHVLTR